MVASDRVSAFDVVMDEPIPGQGRGADRALGVLVRAGPRDLVPNHLVADRAEDLPAAFATVEAAIDGRWLLVRRAERIDIECVVRGYLAGQRLGRVPAAGHACRRAAASRHASSPSGWPSHAFTPAIKAESGHDENISRARLAALVGQRAAPSSLKQLSLELYAAGAEHALSRGLDPGRHQVRVRRCSTAS